MKILWSLFIIFSLLIPSATIGKINDNNDIQNIAVSKRGDAIYRNSNFIAAVNITKTIISNNILGIKTNLNIIKLRNLKIAQAIIETYRVHPNDPNTRSIFFEMLNMYIKRVQRIVLNRNRQFYSPRR